MKLKYILLLPVVVLLAGCGTNKAATGGAVSDGMLVFDKEQVWQLVAMQGREVDKAHRKPSTEVLLMFHPESATVRGRVACNRYFADYKLQKGKTTDAGTRYVLSVDYISGGDVQCPEGDMAIQDRYLALLDKADACLLTPYVLTLFQKDKEVLRFELQ